MMHRARSPQSHVPPPHGDPYPYRRTPPSSATPIHAPSPPLHHDAHLPHAPPVFLFHFPISVALSVSDAGILVIFRHPFVIHLQGQATQNLGSGPGEPQSGQSACGER
ncbi:hypothetical protein EXIGLDRAFT_736351 [Exidia glandulosa HHB12029]|uniref:Uncharacterized protein n=1 Tax=Exidia glandulosa HHB12029 TaxID=1314781 RepID=A0A166N7W3_EXIGL|nr:hypothetical protein EXIGLDRAFT_736351 [Exidia glandulosa HHB12029]